MTTMTKAQAKQAQGNGEIEKLSPEKLAELFVSAAHETVEEDGRP